MPKRPIRSRLMLLRRQLPEEQWCTRSLAVQRRLSTLPEFAQARTVALYSPIHNEVATDRLLAWCLADGKRTLYPRVVGDQLEFVEAGSLGELARGCFGVLEPCGGQVVAPAEIDLLLVPGVGFDRSGHRLGYGKGFYDRALQAEHPGTLRVGIGFDFQLVDQLPAEAHDVRLQLLVTESNIYRFAAPGTSAAEVYQRQSQP